MSWETDPIAPDAAVSDTSDWWKNDPVAPEYPDYSGEGQIPNVIAKYTPPEWANNAASAVLEKAQGFIPHSVHDAAALLSPVVGGIDADRQSLAIIQDVARGMSVDEATRKNAPERFEISDAEKTPPFSKERFGAAFGTVAQLLMAKGIAGGLKGGKPNEALRKTGTIDPKMADAAKNGEQLSPQTQNPLRDNQDVRSQVEPSASGDTNLEATVPQSETTTSPKVWQLPSNIEPGTEAAIAELNKQLGPKYIGEDYANISPETGSVGKEKGSGPVLGENYGQTPPDASAEVGQPKSHLEQVLEENEPLSPIEQREVQRELDAEMVREQSGGKIVKGSELPTKPPMEMHSGVPMPEFMKVSPETHADVVGGVGGFFKASKFTPFRETLNKWVGDRQRATLEGKTISEAVKKEQPNSRKQIGISIYREAGGDTELIKRQLLAAKPAWFKMAAHDALNLSPKDIETAQRLDAWYLRKGQRAQATGLIEHLRKNYVNHIWEDTPEARNLIANASKLNPSFRPSRERIVPTLFEGAQAGLKPKTLVASELASVYAHSMDRALGDRGFVKRLLTTEANDGRPLAIAQQEAAAMKQAGTGNFEDYKPVRHWTFKGEDYRGDILVHPDYAGHVEAAIRHSTIDRPEYAATAAGRLARRGFQKLLSGQSFVKQNMLSIPAFHYVQEGTEGIGHRVNPFAAKPINPRDPIAREAMDHGLMLASTHGGEAQWMEGLQTSKALLNKIPGIGPKLKASSEYLFQVYIPSVKLETYKAGFNRNLRRFKGQLDSGKMSMDDVKYHTAKQVNDAYGHLNYADMGRSENVQKITRAILLAPDFLEARARQAAQGAAGLIPGKNWIAHGEQRMAFWTLAVGQYVLARGLNYMLDDKKLHLDWRDAFAVYHNGRRYSMRSVPGDVLEAVEDWRKFSRNRLSPVVRGEEELRTGLNWRGQKVDTAQTIKNIATMPIPLGLKNLAAMIPGLEDVGDKEMSWSQQGMQNLGVKVQKASPIIDAHKIAHSWMAKQPDFKEDTGTYPTSRYRPLQNALEDNNIPAAQRAYRELLGSMKPEAIKKGMNMSLGKSFTKSKAGDELMLRQISKDDRQTMNEAVGRRKQILARFGQIEHSRPTLAQGVKDSWLGQVGKFLNTHR